MAIIKLVESDYLNEYAVYNVIYYIIGSPYLIYSGYMALPYPYTSRNIEETALVMKNAFECVRHVYNKDSEKKRLLEHVVIGFEPGECITTFDAEDIAWKIAGFIGQRFQTVYGVHKGSHNNTDYMHIHMAVNRISYVDGKRFYETKGEMAEILEFAKSIRSDLEWRSA